MWGGHADKAKTKPWQRDTLVNVYSTTKGLTAICAHRLIDQGKLDPDEPVSKYWPEFAQAGKKDLAGALHPEPSRGTARRSASRSRRGHI